MGAPKQKWSDAEEDALKNGVAKYGTGKWRAIQKDPKFGPTLTSRSNVDLKDKWRNMSVGDGGTPGGAASPKAAPSAEKPKKEKASPAPTSPTGSKKKQIKPAQYEEKVVEAVKALKGGSTFKAIVKWIEDQGQTGADFKEKLAVRVKVMVHDTKLLHGKGGSYVLGEAKGSVKSPPAKRGGDSRGILQKNAAAAAVEAAKAIAEAEKAARAAEQAALEAAVAEREAVVAEAAAKKAKAAASRPPKKR